MFQVQLLPLRQASWAGRRDGKRAVKSWPSMAGGKSERLTGTIGHGSVLAHICRSNANNTGAPSDNIQACAHVRLELRK